MELFPQGVKELLRVLKSKAFYQNRFLDQVLALYESDANARNDDVKPTLYLSACFRNIPAAKQQEIGEWCAKRLVTFYKECPTPSELIELIGEGALAAWGLSYVKLFIRAQDFFLYPPGTQAIADRWIEKVIYTVVQSIGREQFALLDHGQWRTAVARVITGEGALKAMVISSVEQKEQVKRTHDDFKTLRKQILTRHSDGV